MPPASSFPRGLLALGLLALAVAALAGVLLIRRATHPAAPGAQAASPEAGGPCEVPAFTAVRALPEADGPPVLLWAVGGVRLYLDDVAAFSPPEAPRHFAVGEHAVRLEAEGHSPLLTRVRFEPWTPALLHAQVDPEVGLTLVRVNAPCTVCPAPMAPVETLAHVPSSTPPGALLSRAASALRRNAWPEALAALEGVPVAQRRTPLFLRLASAVHTDAHASQASRRALAALPPAASQDLAPLLARLTALQAQEEQRRQQVQLRRWNRTTERFGALVARFEPQVPQAVSTSSRRLESLTPAFERALRQQDALGAEEALRAAEEALATLVTQLRSARPSDCAFQAEVVATASQ